MSLRTEGMHAELETVASVSGLTAVPDWGGPGSLSAWTSRLLLGLLACQLPIGITESDERQAEIREGHTHRSSSMRDLRPLCVIHAV